MPGFSLKGLQDAQKRNLRRIAALKPGGFIDAVLQWAAGEAHRHWTYYTPHETGALRASRRIEMDSAHGRAIVFTAPEARNPKSKTPPAEYDVYLHAQGFIPGLRSGIRASAPYTVIKIKPRLQAEMTRKLGKVLVNP